MKKNYFMLALATMMMAACANNDLVDDLVQEEAPQAIDFEPFANKSTRAEIEDVTALEGVGFQVWGYKAPTADPMVWTNQYTVFNNVTVSYNNGWKYNDPQYWDRTSTYKFYAVAPAAKSASYTIDPTTGMISITGAESAISTESMDYLIDRNGVENVDGNYTSTTPHATVNFDFHHIMTKVSFKLMRAVAEEIKVTNLTMTGWDSGLGTFEQKYTATPNGSNDYLEWTISTAGAGNVTLVGDDAEDASILLDDDSAKDVQDTYIMVPQAIAAETLTFTIDFEINGEKFIGQVGKLATKQIWGTDVHVTYTIKVGPQEIAFDVNSVCDWEHNTSDPEIEIE